MELIPTTESAEETIKFKVDVDDGDFKMIEQGDSTFYLKQLYEGLDGRNVQFDERLIRNIDVRMKIDFSVLQYTIDDNPAYPLAFTYESNWCDLTAKNGIIQIPHFYNSGNSKKIFEVLGFDSNEELEDFIQEKNIDRIKPESIKEQTDFYTRLIRDKNKYESCCPEYIAQAEEFLNSHMDTLDTFHDLGLELSYRKLTIDIQGQLRDGVKFHKVIVEVAGQ